MHGVFGRWAELVGAEVGAHCTPGVVRRRQARRPHRLDRLGDPAEAARADASYAGSTRSSAHGTVTLIEVLGPHLPSWKKGRRSVRDGRGPRDTYG